MQDYPPVKWTAHFLKIYWLSTISSNSTHANYPALFNAATTAWYLDLGEQFKTIFGMQPIAALFKNIFGFTNAEVFHTIKTPKHG